MKTFKQFLLAEEPQKGKTIIFYHRTGLGGQFGSQSHLKQDDTEAHVDSFLKSGFHVGEGDMFGKGVYGFYTEKAMLSNQKGGEYGNIVLKIKVNTNKILITVKEVAKTIYGRPLTLEEQFKTLKLKYDPQKMMVWEEMYNRSENVGLSIVNHYGKNKMPKLVNGLVYTGGHDSDAMVVYDTKLLTIISYNTTLKNSSKLDGTWISVLGKNKEQIKTALMTSLSVASSYERVYNKTEFLKNFKKYVIKNYDTMPNEQRRRIDSRLIEYLKIDGNSIQDLIIDAGLIPSEAIVSAAIDGGWYQPPKNIHNKLSTNLKKKVEDNQLAAVEKNWEAIKNIIDAGLIPSEAVQIAAAKQSWKTMAHLIKAGIKPSEAVQDLLN